MTDSFPSRAGGLADEAGATGDRFTQARASEWRITGGALLILCVVMAVLPAWGFAGYVAARFALGEQQSLENAGRLAARAAASAMDFRIGNLESAMSTLALSRQFASGDLAGLYAEATVLAQTQRVTVALTEPDGRQLFNTQLPFGSDLPVARDLVKIEEAVRTGRTQYSVLYHGLVSQRWLLGIVMPLRRDGNIAAVLVVALDTVRLWDEVLASIDRPATWPIALVDETHRVAARQPDGAQFAGRKVHPDAAAVLTDAEFGSGLGQSIDGKPVYVHFHRIRRTPWLVLAGVPRHEVDDAVVQAVLPVMISGLAILLATILAAWMLGRRFTQQLAAIATAASAYRDGAAPTGSLGPSRIAELEELKRTLDSVGAERTRYEEQLKSLLADKDLLMMEVHHRVKNSLQLVRGILSLQARSASHAQAKEALNAAAARILTVADVHQHLYQGSTSAQVDVRRYLEDLAQGLAKSMLDGEPDRSVTVDAPTMEWPAEKLTTLGLIMTELVTNAIKYGSGVVAVQLAVEPDAVILVVEDGGEGFPPDFKLGEGSGLGSKLITSLVRPQDGSTVIDRNVTHGRVIVTLGADWRRAVD